MTADSTSSSSATSPVASIRSVNSFLTGIPTLLPRHAQTGPDAALIWLEGISTRRQAATFTGKYLSASPEDEAALEEGEYFHYQLIGLQVRTEEGEALGELQEILETGSNDVYIVRGEDGEVLIPAMAQVVLEVNVAGGIHGRCGFRAVCADVSTLTRFLGRMLQSCLPSC